MANQFPKSWFACIQLVHNDDTNFPNHFPIENHRPVHSRAIADHNLSARELLNLKLVFGVKWVYFRMNYSLLRQAIRYTLRPPTVKSMPFVFDTMSLNA
jgi:hypothetical protein